MKKILLFLLLFAWHSSLLLAQVGEYRNDFSVGVTGGYVMSSVNFTPTVPQASHTGMTGGVAFRYVCEKYFKTVASVYGEINYTQMGWKEDIRTKDNAPVINGVTGLAEEYSRTINYVQVPIMAHLAWGQEHKGFNFFVNLGPQFGFFMSEKTEMNFNFDDRNTADRATTIAAQDTMAIEKKFDYGIVAGGGIEYSIPRVGHFLLEGRYYYGLGNLYGDSKRDFFGSSNFSTIMIKLSYLFDITKTKNKKH